MASANGLSKQPPRTAPPTLPSHHSRIFLVSVLNIFELAGPMFLTRNFFLTNLTKPNCSCRAFTEPLQNRQRLPKDLIRNAGPQSARAARTCVKRQATNSPREPLLGSVYACG
jgi:hypothetical protein